MLLTLVIHISQLSRFSLDQKPIFIILLQQYKQYLIYHNTYRRPTQQVNYDLRCNED